MYNKIYENDNNHGQAQLNIAGQRMNSRRRQDSSLLVQSD